MTVKIILLVSILKIANCGLLRTPKVYNALITTDDNITPSRSFPIIQPHIHETGIAYPSYPFANYNPFSLYDPYSTFGDGSINPTFISRNNVPGGFGPIQQRNHFGIPHSDNSNDPSLPPDNGQNNSDDRKANKNSSQSPSQTSNESNEPPQQNQITDVSPKQPDNSLITSQPNEKSPIPLNEFGLPPALIPFGPYGNNYPVQQNPINLAPYAYNSYPLAFDQYNGYQPGYQPNPYLPPFGYYPQPLDFSQLASNNNRRFSKSGNQPQAQPSQPLPNIKQYNSADEQPQLSKQNPAPKPSQELLANDPQPPPVVPLSDIKNFANKNKDIPDVPPPPLPSGAKTTSADE